MIAHGYALMFLAMCLEGPSATTAASFAAALGHFNPVYVVLLSILGDLVPDAILYAIGYWSRTSVIERYGHKVGLTTTRMRRIEHLLANHPVRAITAAKFMPVVAIVCIMLIGSLRYDFKKFMGICLMVSGPRSIILALVGFYAGWTYDLVNGYLQTGTLVLLGIVVAVVVYLIYRVVTKRISEPLIDGRVP
jgi:membrane protein DedA with SNARE-associated domain